MARRGAFLALLALASVGCSDALTSDPEAWAPLRLDAGSLVASDAATVLDPACLDEPPYDPELRTSSATSVSHLSGQPCLAGCHEAGGSAKTIFAAAGTVYESQTSRAVATHGTVQGIGGSTVPVDRCGNVYAIASALKTQVAFSQPFVQNPTFRRMDKALLRQKDPGSCNQASCHDFGGKLRWGVYF
jgi:hypothetical protein